MIGTSFQMEYSSRTCFEPDANLSPIQQSLCADRRCNCLRLAHNVFVENVMAIGWQQIRKKFVWWNVAITFRISSQVRLFYDRPYVKFRFLKSDIQHCRNVASTWFDRHVCVVRKQCRAPIDQRTRVTTRLVGSTCLTNNRNGRLSC